ncbi:TIR domain-containing protein [Litorimonas haliclonae]|uniref:TIR domain-containing protein n=1 Tax=Litorimonas haliclonae TaxID=2081977 RepID=UPI0039EF0A80
MSLSTARSNIARTQKSIADLRAKDAAESKKEADLNSKINRASESASRSSSSSIIQSKFKEIERYQKALAACAKKRAEYAKQMASKTNELNRNNTSLEREEKSQRDNQAKQAKKVQDDLERRQKSFERGLSRRLSIAAQITETPISNIEETFDVFISHASEDKESFVKGLADALAEAGIKVWYDEFSLTWGDSLRKEIDRGLSNSRFGIVVLSESFFSKSWPQTELDGLVSLEMSGASRILPIWHKITKDELTQHSPTLAGRLALNSSIHSVEEIVEKLKKLCGSD